MQTGHIILCVYIYNDDDYNTSCHRLTKLDGQYSESVQIPAKAIADFLTVTLRYITVRGYDSACKCKM